jgi:hypothetical protein
MSGGGSYSRESSKQQSGPWSGTQPYLRDIYGEAQRQYYNNQGPYTFYPRKTYAPTTPEQERADYYDVGLAEGTGTQQDLGALLSSQMGAGTGLDLTGALDYAGGGQDPYMQRFLQMSQGGYPSEMFDPVGREQLTATAQGDYLTGNPYLDAQFQQASQQVGGQFQDITQPGITATFGGAGRTGGGLHGQQIQAAQGELSRELGDMATDIYGQNYQQERARQLAAAGLLGEQDLGASAQSLQAAQAGSQQALDQRALGADVYGNVQGQALAAGGMVPQQLGMMYQNIDRLRGVGERGQAEQQRAINEAMDRFYFEQEAPAQALARYASIIEGLQQQQSLGRSKGYSTGGYGGVGGGSGGK